MRTIAVLLPLILVAACGSGGDECSNCERYPAVLTYNDAQEWIYFPSFTVVDDNGDLTMTDERGHTTRTDFLVGRMISVRRNAEVDALVDGFVFIKLKPSEEYYVNSYQPWLDGEPAPTALVYDVERDDYFDAGTWFGFVTP